ncbi:MAG TPA: PDZ domain-containing protein, partial [Phycisphaerae bacterium]
MGRYRLRQLAAAMTILLLAVITVPAAHAGGGGRGGRGARGGIVGPPASAPTAPATQPSNIPGALYKPAPLPAGMADFKTTETAIKTTIKAARAADAVTQPGYLGVTLETKSGKLTVASVSPESPAGRAGIALGDVVVNIDGHIPADEGEFRDLIHAIAPGTTTRINITRGGRAMSLVATIGAVSRPLNASDDRPVLGVQVTEDAGTRIVQVLANSNAARADLRVGDLITRVDDVALSGGTHLADLIATHHFNDVVALSVTRNGQQGIIRVPLAADNTTGGRGGRGRGTGGQGGDSTFYDHVGQIWRNETLKLAVIGIEYPDVKHNASIAVKDWDEALFSKGTYRMTATGQQAYGSMYDYFAEESFGKLKVQGKMLPWVTVSKNRDDYTQGTNGGAMNRTLLPEAIESLLARDGRAALDNYDAVVFVYAGPRVNTNRGGIYWPHKSTTSIGQRRVSYVMIPEESSGPLPVGVAGGRGPRG